ncbi:sodium- and chloride-dependent glycine transporter 2 [Aplysia californica]|uniref:Sodium- and chloride-dependent glycine transporter 2 n=1 Tax=Aplysia californica TaxID=6500 RepID=A0ABM1VZN0_APLCA|nr:sodium- and chloride-dependent glycine transporter 2 [Aplysia californica]
MAYPLYYAAMSCQPDLPWASCGHSWNTDNCREANYTARSLEVLDAVVVAVTNGTEQLINGTTQLGSDVHNVTDDQGSVLRNITALNGTVRGPEEEFWLYGVLDISSGLSDSGSVRWPLLICLAVAWFTIFLCLIKGIKSMGKAAYVAASLPYLILTCLLVRGCLLPGAGVGLYYYMVPEWEQLADFDVWRNATAQVMFSMGMGSGLLNTLASYNKFNNNLQRDAFLLPVMDTVTSIFAGLVIFVYLGHMSYLTGKHMDNVVDEGPGLVFIAYPSALSTLPIPQFWSIIFFLMLFCVGLDSQFLHVQIVITALTDRYPHKLRSRGRLLTAVVCFIFFLLGLPYTMQASFLPAMASRV